MLVGGVERPLRSPVLVTSKGASAGGGGNENLSTRVTLEPCSKGRVCARWYAVEVPKIPAPMINVVGGETAAIPIAHLLQDRGVRLISVRSQWHTAFDTVRLASLLVPLNDLELCSQLSALVPLGLSIERRSGRPTKMIHHHSSMP